MTENEHLLTVLAEECGEVAKEISKSLRFGLDDQLTTDPNGPRGTEGPTNREKIGQEMIDLLAVYQMCIAEGLVPNLGFYTDRASIIEAATAKQERVRAYMDYAKRVGTLTR